MNRAMQTLTENTPPRILALAKQLRDDDIDATPEIATLRDRRTKLESNQAAASQAYEAHRAFVAGLRARLPDLERDIAALRINRANVTARALLEDAGMSAVDKAEHALRTAERELERINIALPVLDVEVAELRSNIGGFGAQCGRVDEEIAPLVFAAKVELARQRLAR